MFVFSYCERRNCRQNSKSVIPSFRCRVFGSAERSLAWHFVLVSSKPLGQAGPGAVQKTLQAVGGGRFHGNQHSSKNCQTGLRCWGLGAAWAAGQPGNSARHPVGCYRRELANSAVALDRDIDIAATVHCDTKRNCKLYRAVGAIGDSL